MTKQKITLSQTMLSIEFLVVAFASGIGISSFFSSEFHFYYLFFFLPPIGTLIFFLGRGEGIRARLTHWPFLPLIPAFCVLCGALYALTYASLFSPPTLNHEISTTVTLHVKSSILSPKKQTITANVIKARKNAKELEGQLISLSYLKAPIDVKPHDKIRAFIKLIPEKGPLIPGGFDFSKNANQKGIYASGYIFKVLQVSTDNSFWSSPFLSIRNQLNRSLYNNMPPKEGGLARALIVGDQSGISKTVRESFSGAGLSHILAISGLHLSLLAGLIFFIIRTGLAFFKGIAQRVNTKKIAALFSLGGATIYLLISGSSIPTQRAYISLLFVILAIFIDRNPISLRTVAIAALGVLLLSPQALFTPSFELSFAAVIALVAFYKENHNFLQGHFLHQNKRGKIFLFFTSIIFSSLIATLATTPFTIYFFYKFSALALLGNLLALPLFTFLIMPLVLSVLLLGFFGLEWLLLPLLSMALSLIAQISDWVSILPGANVLVSAKPISFIVLYVYGMLSLIILPSKFKKIGLLFLGGALLVAIFAKAPKEALIISKNGGKFGYIAKEKLYTNQIRRLTFESKYWAAYFGIPEKNIIRLRDIKKTGAENIQFLEDQNCWLLGKKTVFEEKNGNCQDLEARGYFLSPNTPLDEVHFIKERLLAPKKIISLQKRNGGTAKLIPLD